MSGEKTHKVYIGLGSNLGDRQANILCAVESISAIDGVLLTKVSPIYETDPVGGPPQGKYLNGAIEVICTLSPHGLLERLVHIEIELGRTRKGGGFPRTIDLDILLYGGIILADKDLTVPHPRMEERDFVMTPLRDIRA